MFSIDLRIDRVETLCSHIRHHPEYRRDRVPRLYHHPDPRAQLLMPKWFRAEKLRALNPPTAGAFVMESVGGAYGEDAISSGKRGSDFDSANGAGVQPSRTFSEAESAISDTMERGENLELRPQSGSRSQMQRPGAR